MNRPKPRLYRGFRDIFSADLKMRNRMIDQIRAVYELYGYIPLETPAVEYVDVLGKFLPESDQPEGGIFSFKNEDREWVALRYDLTAPLSRVVAHYKDIKRPYRRYQIGPVYRLEKPGPGRFREFYQFDFDSVGTSSMAADAEVCCVMCDALEAVGIDRGQYVIRVNNRKVLNGVLDAMGLGDFRQINTYVDSHGIRVEKEISTLDIFRSIDKLDKIGVNGVIDLLTNGRMDPSGDFTPGLELDDAAVTAIETYLNTRAENRSLVCGKLLEQVGESKVGCEGVKELTEIDSQLASLGYDEDRVIFDPTVVRGLDYYTGPVFEGELTFKVVDDKGISKSFGSVFGGGRYDDLVERFTGQKVPATGASIGVDRLLAALKHLGRVKDRLSTAQVLVTVMDSRYIDDYQVIAQELRQVGINTELFVGKGNIGRQLKYADSLNIPIAVIAGEDEFAVGELQIKDLWLGSELSEEILDRETWRKDRPAQFAIQRSDLVSEVRAILTRYKNKLGEI